MPKRQSNISAARAAELYLQNDRNITVTAKQLKTTYSVIYHRLQEVGLKKSYKPKPVPISVNVNPGGYTYADIDRLLFEEGTKIATPRGRKAILKIYPYMVAVNGSNGRIEYCTKGELLVCYLKALRGQNYIEKEGD